MQNVAFKCSIKTGSLILCKNAMQFVVWDGVVVVKVELGNIEPDDEVP